MHNMKMSRTCCMTRENGPGRAPYVPVANMADVNDRPNRFATWVL